MDSYRENFTHGDLESLEINDERQKQIGDQARADAEEYLQRVRVDRWIPQNARLKGFEPLMKEVKPFFNRTEGRLGILKEPEVFLYIEEFMKTCRKGYPQAEA